MISSMTGYGEVHRSVDGVAYALETKSVNNRYLKPIIKLPESVQFAECEIDKAVRARISRGSVSINLRVRNTTATAAHDVNEEALRHYAASLAKVELPNGLQATIDLATLSTLPGVCQAPVVDDDWKSAQLLVIKEMTEECIDQLVEMRGREGQVLHDDLLGHCARMGDLLDGVSKRAPVVVTEYQQRLTNRVQALMSDGSFQLEADSLSREVALFADRCDISEEIVRLRGHVDHFVETCDAEGAVGRKLDFLAQEMLREVNTIGSKSNDGEIARAVVELKSLVDRIKEQVQNAE